MAEFFATFWNDIIIYWVWPLLLFLVGFGAVVFVHEFGHFIMAKRAGIRVNRFAIGFFHPIISYRKGLGVRLGSSEQEYQARAAQKLINDGVNVGALLDKQRELKINQAATELGLGETEYRINWLPVGGYVHMSGQDDFAPESSNETVDPRGYASASVGKRFGVIAAGVVMNLIFAAILFPIIGLIGMNFPAPVVGSPVPGFPAAKAEIQWEGEVPPEIPSDISPPGVGLRPGDRITHIEADGFFASMMGGKTTRFQDLKLPAALSDKNDRLTVDLERTVDGKAYRGRAKIGLRNDPSMDVLILGLAPAGSNEISKMGMSQVIIDTPLKGGDRITHVAGQPVTMQPDIDRIAATLDGTPIEVRLARDGGEETLTVQPQMLSRGDLAYRADGSMVEGWVVRTNTTDEVITYTGPDGTAYNVEPGQTAVENNDGQVTVLPSEELVGGAGQTLGDLVGFVPRLQILGVNKGTPAELAGLKPGDIILAYGTRALPTLEQVWETSREVGENETQITVLRDGTSLTLKVTPEEKGQGVFMGFTQQLDLTPIAAHIRKGSLAEKAGLEPGTRILAIDGQPVDSWIDIYRMLASHAESHNDAPVTLSVRNGSLEKEVSLGPFGETQRRNLDAVKFKIFSSIPFETLESRIQFHNPITAIGWGFKETANWMVTVYGQLAGMARGTVGVKSVGGPLAIGATAVTFARTGVMKLVYFMALLSVLLAVFNFLPLPVLDGGHAVLLLIEKIRGRPLPAKLVYGIQMVGLVLIFGLMIVVFIKDVVDLTS